MKKYILISALLLCAGCVEPVGYVYVPEAEQPQPAPAAPPVEQAVPPAVQPPPAPLTAEVSPSYFYEPLQPYGEWIWSEQYGWVWTPNDMPVGWRPYTDGHWALTDYGWTWVSDLPWGWACFHYGRWYFDNLHGWSWMPGPTWSPAWVVWRTGPDYIGWAPCPPSLVFRSGFGLVMGSVSLEAACPPFWFSFCGVGDFLDVVFGLGVEYGG